MYLGTALRVVLTGLVLPAHERQPQTLRITLLLFYLFFFLILKSHSASANDLMSPFLTCCSYAHTNIPKSRRQLCINHSLWSTFTYHLLASGLLSPFIFWKGETQGPGRLWDLPQGHTRNKVQSQPRRPAFSASGSWLLNRTWITVTWKTC